MKTLTKQSEISKLKQKLCTEDDQGRLIQEK